MRCQSEKFSNYNQIKMAEINIYCIVICVRHCSMDFTYLFYHLLINNPIRKYYYFSHFTGGENRGQFVKDYIVGAVLLWPGPSSSRGEKCILRSSKMTVKESRASLAILFWSSYFFYFKMNTRMSTFKW